MIEFETSVQIERPIEEVFAYVSDPRNFPVWNSAVEAVEPTSPSTDEVGATYTMERSLPGGRAMNRLEVVGRERPHEFAVRASVGPTPFVYHYRFAGEDGVTVLRLAAQVELTGLGAVLPQLARRAVRSGVDDNLALLKGILETAGSDERGAGPHPSLTA
jgi:uncharacterized membrane protein